MQVEVRHADSAKDVRATNAGAETCAQAALTTQTDDDVGRALKTSAHVIVLRNIPSQALRRADKRFKS